MASTAPSGLARSIAPEFDASLSWLNTAPITLAGLRGHPVVLLFWNAGSAHCHNALQTIGPLAARFREGATFIAVHVPKFDCERDGAVAWDVLQGEGAALPLVNDGDWAAWQQYALSAWPTAVLVDAQGFVRERFVGDRAIESLLPALEAEVDANFLSSPGHAGAPRLDMPNARGSLVAPGGLVANASRLYIADTGNHRILECTHDGRILRRIGNGTRDFVDGLADVAGFNAPRGMALLQDRLYVADTGNHAIRRINMRTGEVDTLVGTGRSGEPLAGVFRMPKDVALDRPWSLAVVDSTLLVTLAAAHQVWAVELGTGLLRHVSGSGRFGDDEGTSDEASFAQPTGLAVLGDRAYTLDASSSSLREIRLADGSVRNLFGRGLFEFGLKEGGVRQALMQYPTALAALPNGQGLWIADTGNGALRRWVVRNQALTTVTLPTALHRPSALAAWQGQLWIADAGNHVVWRFDSDSGEMHRLPVGE
jgi:thiol-disulfide isomerase/thioredoxin